MSMAKFVAQSWKFTRCHGQKDDYRILFYAYKAVDWSGSPATFEAADKGDEEDLARDILTAVGKAWPDRTITLDVDASDSRILKVLSVP
jgi:hypothetical protein